MKYRADWHVILDFDFFLFWKRRPSPQEGPPRGGNCSSWGMGFTSRLLTEFTAVLESFLMDNVPLF